MTVTGFMGIVNLKKFSTFDCSGRFSQKYFGCFDLVKGFENLANKNNSTFWIIFVFCLYSLDFNPSHVATG